MDIKNKFNSTAIFCLVNCLLVFIFYFHTLDYSWKHFDENIIFQEAILPIPHSPSEAFEILKLFGPFNHFEASNPFYSNISNLRGTPLDTIFCLFIFSVFKKSAFAYHLFSVILHVINTCFVFFILNKISYKNQFVVSALTLLWALHPANVESVLFATNFGALITYLFCFSFFLYYLNLINHKENTIRKLTFLESALLFLLYLFPLFLNEYSVTLVLILFSYLFAFILFKNPKTSFKDALTLVFTRTLPMLLALVLFVISFLSFPVTRTTQENNLYITLERIFWLSPQIFTHFLKLIFIPIHLSIDQTAFVQFSNSLFEPYAIFCIFLTFVLVFISIISFFYIRQKMFFNLFVLFALFFLSIIPFLHIFSPAYCLCSERYLYFPIFFIVFGIAHIAFHSAGKGLPWQTLTLGILCIFSIQTYTRTLDWKDGITLLKSAVEIAPNNLFKALRTQMQANAAETLKELPYEIDAKEYTKEALLLSNKAFEDFKNDEIKYQKHIPGVIKFYGLDPKTFLAKTAFLSAYCEVALSQDYDKAFKIFSPYADDLPHLDNLILDFYYKISFYTKNTDLAEAILLKSYNQNRLSPILLVALSDLSEYKYNDLDKTKKYLNESFKYFPYDSLTIFGLKRLYQKLNNAEQFAHFSYLYGLRMHDPESLQDAIRVYLALNKKDEAKTILKNANLN